MILKMLCSDLDGTLLGLKNRTTPKCNKVFNTYKDRLKVVLVSARMPSGMYYIQRELGIENQPIICYNGALVMHGTKTLSSHYISLNLVAKISELSHTLNVAVGLYSHDQWTAPARSERIDKEEFNTQTKVILESNTTTLKKWGEQKIGAHKLMLMGTKQNTDELFDLLIAQYSADLGVYRSNDTLIEITPGGIDKLSGIKSLLDQNIGLENIVAFGDNFNDISMLSGVGYGVAVENGREAVKEIAKETIDSCLNDGVANFLLTFLDKHL
jgi:Cof subfamily protein (haloacid dehalogenase superfamily)|tara:strand:- start:3251 stop:4060 length:810 start_codon:yes stop_codon:yes gene_type:complete